MLEQIRELYEGYFAEFQRLEQGRQAGAGMFGLTNGPRNYPCHDQFAKDLERLLRETEETLSPDQAEELLEYILFAPQSRERERDAVYWMLIAVHGMTERPAGRLDPAAAARLLERYEAVYPRRERLPVQMKAVSALKKRAKQR